jgi:hypothetical protein
MSVKSHKLRQCRCNGSKCEVCKWEKKLQKAGLDHLDSENSEGDIIVGNRGSGKIISRKHGEARDESEEAMEHRRAILANHRFRSPRDKRVYGKYAAGFGTPAVAKGLRDSAQHGTSTWAVQRLIARVEREYRADKGQPITHVQLAKLLLECDAATVTLLFELLRRAMDDPSGMGQLLDKAEDIPQIRAILDPAPSDELDGDEEE